MFFGLGCVGRQGVAGKTGRPSLDLSFMTPGALDPRLTFTRASVGTYFDSSGVLQTAASGTPRWDYHPTTHVLNGLSIEETRTNQVLNSADASNATWVKSGAVVVVPTVTGNQVVSPDGATTAAQIVYPTVTGTNAYSIVNATQFVATANQYTFSAWLRGNAGGEQVYLTITQAAVTYYRSLLNLTTSWQRFTITTPNLTAQSWIFSVGTDLRDAGQSTTAAKTIFAWGGQVEVGAYASSYIPTTAATVTRAAEVCTMATVGWINAVASTLAADIMVAQTPNPSATLVRDACALSDVSANNRLMLRAQIVAAGTAAFGTSIAGTTTASASLGATTASAVAKIGAAWNGITGSGSLNGAAAVSYSVGMPAGLTTLTIGNDYSGAAAYLNGWVRRVRYWPRALSAAELQAATA